MKKAFILSVITIMLGSIALAKSDPEVPAAISLTILPLRTDTIGDSSHSIHEFNIIENSGAYGLADSSGVIVVEPRYDKIFTTSVHKYHFLVMQDSIFYFLDIRDGRLYLPKETLMYRNKDRIEIQFENLKFGYIDGDGRSITTEQWDGVTPFHKGLARVINSDRMDLLFTSWLTPGKAGYINKDGEYVIPMEYSYIDLFEESDTTRFNRGVFDYDLREQDPNGNVYHGYKYGLIDNKGNIVLPDNEYDYISHQRKDRNGMTVFVVEKGQRAGVINTHGQLIFPLKRYEARAKGEHEGRVELWMAYEASLKQ